MISEREIDGNAAGLRHPETGALMPPPERMLRLFAYEHLQHADIRALSMRFSDFAHDEADFVITVA